MQQITFGADPEFFLFDESLGECVPALGVTTGTKREPEPLWDGFSIQLDGVALEINTPVYKSRSPLVALRNLVAETSDFVTSPKFRKFINDRLGVQGWHNRYRVSDELITTFSEDMWADVPDKNKELGCDPDYNAYTGEINPTPDPDYFGTTRTAAGHIAIGFVEEGTNLLEHGNTGFKCAQAVAFLLGDMYPRTCLGTRIGDEARRRRFYGGYHAFRPKPFGVEWRAPSNSWLFYKQKSQGTVSTFREALNYLVED